MNHALLLRCCLDSAELCTSFQLRYNQSHLNLKKANAIKASYDQPEVWTQSGIVGFFFFFPPCPMHPCIASACVWVFVHNQTLGPPRLRSKEAHKTSRLFVLRSRGRRAACAASGRASIVRYLGEAWLKASRNQLTRLASERSPPLVFHVIIHSVMFNWATWTQWWDSLKRGRLQQDPLRRVGRERGGSDGPAAPTGPAFSLQTLGSAWHPPPPLLDPLTHWEMIFTVLKAPRCAVPAHPLLLLFAPLVRKVTNKLFSQIYEQGICHYEAEKHIQ